MVTVEHILQILWIMQRHRKAISLEEKCAGIEAAHVPDAAVPLTFILYKF